MIHPLIQREDKDVLFIRDDLYECLKKKPKSILWVHQGLYGIIPVEVIKNEFQIRADREKLMSEPELEIGYWIPLAFNWAEAVEIPQETGRALEYNGRE